MLRQAVCASWSWSYTTIVTHVEKRYSRKFSRSVARYKHGRYKHGHILLCMSAPQPTDWVGRLRCAIGGEPSRSYGSRSLVVLGGSLFLFAPYLTGRSQQPGYLLETLGLTALQLMVICLAVGELLHTRARTLAGLLWVEYLVFGPPFMVLLAARFSRRAPPSASW